jgi:conjugative relaxase-like TrwC/TraI family protein
LRVSARGLSRSTICAGPNTISRVKSRPASGCDSPRLGIKIGQTVEADLFEKLHAGLGPDGRSLITNDGGKERVSGFDLTLSAPKSVSIAYALANPEMRAAIEQVQLDACKAVVAMLNREAAFTRRGKNGVVIEKTSLVVAAFQHGEARPAPHADGRVTADMDLHTHLCIANLGEKSAGENEREARAESGYEARFGALDARPIFKAKMLAGSVYHLAISAGLQKLGFQIEVTGKNGIFELYTPSGPALDDDTKRYFSSRRNQLEDRLADYDLVTGEAQQLAAAVVKATRLSKVSDTRDRFEIWREQAQQLGVDVEHFVERVRTGRDLSDYDREALIAQRLAEVPSRLTEKESVFERRHLMAVVASSLVGTGAGPERVDDEIERLMQTGEIVQLGQDIHGHGLYSTPELLSVAPTAALRKTRRPSSLLPNSLPFGSAWRRHYLFGWHFGNLRFRIVMRRPGGAVVPAGPNQGEVRATERSLG